MSVKVGRNEPCPCGSGKKYKRCCARRSAGISEPAELVWRRLRGLLDEHHAAMLDFTLRTYGPVGLNEAWIDFTAGEEEEFDPETPFIELFFTWMNHWWMPDGFGDLPCPERAKEQEPTRFWLQRHGAKAPRLLRQHLEACLEMHFSFHEVLDVDPGKGLVLMDLLLQTRHEVLEKAASQSLEPGQIIFGGLVETEGVTLIEGMGSTALEVRHKLAIIDWRESFREELVELEVEPTRENLQEHLREHSDELVHGYLDWVDELHHPPLPEVVNTDGEPLEPQRLLFDIDDAEAAFAALSHLDFEWDPEDIGEWVERDAEGGLLKARIDWKRPGNAQHPSWENTILGKLSIEPGRLSVEVNSNERAARLRELVTEALGDAARYRLTSRESLEAALSDPSRHASSEASEAEQEALLENPDVQAFLQNHLAAHYAVWPEQPLPALGGQTALEAVQTPLGREKVEALLKDFESKSARMRPTPDPEVFERLRQRLGLL